MKVRKIAFISALFFLGAGGASASTAILVEQNPFDVFDRGGHQGLYIRINSHWVRQQVSEGDSGLNDGADNSIARCFNNSGPLPDPDTYETTNTPFTNSYGLSASRIDNVEKPFSANYSALDAPGNVQSAGFQPALWKLLYECMTGFEEANGGSAGPVAQNGSTPQQGPLSQLGSTSQQRTTSGRGSSSTGFSSANQSLNNFVGAGGQGGNAAYRRSGGDSRNSVGVTPVPLPAAGLMLGFGLAGLYCAGRFKKAKAASLSEG